MMPVKTISERELAMKGFLFVAAAISAAIGLFGLASIRSDIQIIISLIGLGFAIVFIALARILSIISRTE